MLSSTRPSSKLEFTQDFVLEIKKIHFVNRYDTSIFAYVSNEQPIGPYSPHCESVEFESEAVNYISNWGNYGIFYTRARIESDDKDCDNAEDCGEADCDYQSDYQSDYEGYELKAHQAQEKSIANRFRMMALEKVLYNQRKTAKALVKAPSTIEKISSERQKSRKTRQVKSTRMQNRNYLSGFTGSSVYLDVVEVSAADDDRYEE